MTLCTEPPMPSSAPLTASIFQPGISLRFPTRRHNFLLVPPTPAAAGCFSVAPGKTAAAGPGLLRVTAGNSSTQTAQVDYYESVAVAFGRRPYIAEAQASLL